MRHLLGSVSGMTATLGLMCVGLPLLRQPLGTSAAPATAKLTIESFTGDSMAFNSNAALIMGPTEAILVDALYLTADARRIADRISASGKHLKAIVLTHPDDDHYYGVATILERFPGTPVYMSAAGIEEFNTRELPNFKAMKARIASMPPNAGRQPPPVPDSLIVPVPFPAGRLTVDGEAIEVTNDQQGDVLKPCNSFFWIPSIRTVVAGDIVFNGVHVWLAASNEASRSAWQASLRRIADLNPDSVVAGHKRNANTPNDRNAVKATAEYLLDFEGARKSTSTPDALVAEMDKKYSGLAVHQILVYAARRAFAN